MFEGSIMGKDKIHVSILQFANDTLLFWKYDDGMLDNLWEKSTLCGVNVDEDKLLLTTACLPTRLSIYLFIPWSSTWWVSEKGLFLAVDYR